MLECHESPSRKPSIGGVKLPRAGQFTDDTIRTNKLDLDISSLGVLDPHTNVNVFECLKIVLFHHFLCDGHLVLITVVPNSEAPLVLVLLFRQYIHFPVVDLNGLRVEPCLGLDQLPILCRLHKGIAVQSTVTVFIAEHVPSSCLFPVGVVGIDKASSFDTEVLDIAPSQVRPITLSHSITGK